MCYNMFALTTTQKGSNVVDGEKKYTSTASCKGEIWVIQWQNLLNSTCNYL